MERSFCTGVSKSTATNRAAPSSWKSYSNVISLHILKSLSSGKLTLPGDFEKELVNDAPARVPLSLLSSAYPRPRLCNSPQHHQSWWCLFSFSCQMINLCLFVGFFGGSGGLGGGHAEQYHHVLMCSWLVTSVSSEGLHQILKCSNRSDGFVCSHDPADPPALGEEDRDF